MMAPGEHSKRHLIRFHEIDNIANNRSSIANNGNCNCSSWTFYDPRDDYGSSKLASGYAS